MDQTQDLYGILGVSASATLREITERYNAASKRLHPTVNSHKGAALQFANISSAYQILSDERSRRDYDAGRSKLGSETTYFTMPVLVSKQTLPLLEEPQVIYALIQVSPNKEVELSKRKSAPLNLTLVLDRSKSMKGERLDRVKVAAHQIIDQLSDTDNLSIVTFSDKADPIIPSQAVVDKNSLKAVVNLMNADGGTEIFNALSEAMRQSRRNLSSDYVNHIILITDGKTYDDENLSLELADTAGVQGIGISTMGIGDEWNDQFLDQLATKTGGSSAYINSPSAVIRFLNERVRSLGSAYAERLMVSLAPDPDVRIESVFKLMPNPHPLDATEQPIPLGTMENNRPVKLIVQLQIPPIKEAGSRSIMRVEVTGDILQFKRTQQKVITDLYLHSQTSPPIEEPPKTILDALGKLTLYRMQQKAEMAIKEGRFDDASTRLQNLATRLLEVGQNDLAQTAMKEARNVEQTRTLSPEGQKTMKFGTRLLISPDDPEGEIS